MKKTIFFLILIVILLTGCGKYNENDLISDLDKKISKSSYYLEGNLEIVNNDNVYNYEVKVSYKKDNNYRVSLLNKSNNHEQIILKNSEGVFVVTPALNKSFKFQSDWPYNNSQVYLLQSVLNDIKNDDKRQFKSKNGNFIFNTEVNYPNNRKLVSQEIVISKNHKFDKIKVLDENGIALMTMDFKKIDFTPTFKKNYFELNTVMESAKVDNTTKEVDSLEDSIYPLVLPTGTKLTNEEKAEEQALLDAITVVVLLQDRDNPKYTQYAQMIENYKEPVKKTTFGFFGRR